MTKFTNESALGRKRAASYMGRPQSVAEAPTTRAAQTVDTSVTLGPLQGEPRGCVDINSPAYTGKFKGA